MASVTIASPYVNSNTSSTNPRDDSFSSYLPLAKESSTELGYPGRTRSSFQINSSRRRTDDGEIDIFSAEKYFNGRMDYTPDALPDKELNLPHQKEAKHSPRLRSRKTASTSMTASGNSRTGLLRQHSKSRSKADRKKFLGVFPCTCSGKDAVDTEEEFGSERESFDKHNLMDAIRLASEMRMERLELGFTEGLFSGFTNLKGIEAKEVFVRELREGEKNVSVGTMETLNKVCNGGADTYNGGDGRDCDNYDDGDDDIGSESSSDLFEISSMSIKSHPFFEPDMVESEVYEPSEASIEWSVVTASAANCSVASEFDEPEKDSTKQNRKGLLMGCVSHKAVNVRTGSHRYKLPKRADTVEKPDAPVQIGHDRFAVPGMRYRLESLKKIESGPTRAKRAVLPTLPLSRIQAQQPIYIQ